MTAETKTTQKTVKDREVKKNQIKCALNLTEDQYDKILSVTPSVRAGKCSVRANEITYGGTVVFNAVFLSDELSRVEAGAKFSFKSAIEGEANDSYASFSIEDTSVRNDGGMLYAVCTLITELTVVKNVPVEYVCALDALVKTETLVRVEKEKFEKTFTLDDEFQTKRIKRALSSEAFAIITAVTAEDNCAVVDGEAVLNVCLLPFSENGDIIKENRVIPFRYEIEANASDGAECAAKAEIEKVSLKIFVDEESGKSSVSAAIDICVSGYAQNTSEEAFVADAFSDDKELKISKEIISQSAVTAFKSGSRKISDKAVCTVPEYSRFIKLIGERIESSYFEKDGDNLVIGGLIVGDALFSDDEERLVNKPFSMPFEFSERVDGDADELTIMLESANAKLRSGEMECDLNLDYSFVTISTMETEIVTKVEETGDKKPNVSAVSVYVGRRGDEEWDVVKALGVDGATITEFNEGVSFPLKGGEKIMVFRRL